MEAAEGTDAPAPGRRWGAVLGISALAVGAVVIGPRLVSAEAVSADGVVTCAISPVIEFSEKLTNSGAADMPFTANLLAGTVACADGRAVDKKIVGAKYQRESFAAKGNCASFSLDKAEVTVEWLVLGGEPEKSKVTVADLDGSGTKPPTVTVEGGPFKDWKVTAEVNDLTLTMATTLKEVCDAGKAIDKTATSMNLVFSPSGEIPPSSGPGNPTATGVVPSPGM